MFQKLLSDDHWLIVGSVRSRVSCEKGESFRKSFRYKLCIFSYFACLRKTRKFSCFFAKFRFNLFCEKMLKFRKNVQKKLCENLPKKYGRFERFLGWVLANWIWVNVRGRTETQKDC